MNARFWVVWCIGGDGPTVMHQSEDFARGEAARLARLHRGKRFAVLESKGYAVTDDVRWVGADGAETDIPF